MLCPECGNTLPVDAKFCNKCGNRFAIEGAVNAEPQTVTVVNNYVPKKNTLATVGLVFAILGMLTSMLPIPFLGTIIWLVGLVFSFIGLFKKPRGKAIAGLIISFIDLIIIVFVLGALGVGFASMGMF